MKKLATAFVALTLFVVASSAHAVSSVTFSNSAPTNVKKQTGVVLRASATFVISNLDLVVTLSNLGTSNTNSPGDIVTGVFFDVAGNPALTPVSATVGPDSKVIGHHQPIINGDVGEEWAYNGDLVDAPAGDVYGISSTKLKSSFFKKSELFPFPDGKIRGTSPLSGAQFGITSLNDVLNDELGGLKNKPLIQNTVVFVFSLPSNLSSLTVEDISDVTFQYGTSIKKGLDITGEMVAQVPEPSTVTLVALSLVGALALTRSRTRHS
jgi:hypothetical protein